MRKFSFFESEREKTSTQPASFLFLLQQQMSDAKKKTRRFLKKKKWKDKPRTQKGGFFSELPAGIYYLAHNAKIMVLARFARMLLDPRI